MGTQVLRFKHPDFDTYGKVKIENWTYVVAYPQIMPGVTIGEGELVAAVEPYTVVGEPQLV